MDIYQSTLEVMDPQISRLVQLLHFQVHAPLIMYDIYKGSFIGLDLMGRKRQKVNLDPRWFPVLNLQDYFYIIPEVVSDSVPG